MANDTATRTKLPSDPSDLDPHARPSDIRELSAGELAPGDAAIRVANQELELRTQNGLELIVSALIEQRNAALRALAGERERASERIRQLEAQEDDFIGLLIADHERELEALRDKLLEGRVQRRPLTPILPVRLTESTDAAELSVVLRSAEQDIAQLREQLVATQEELKETEADVARLRRERDASVQEATALRAQADDLAATLEMRERDAEQHGTELLERLQELEESTQLTLRRLGDELSETKRLLAERTTELSQLKASFEQLDEQVHSLPPPSRYLEHAQREAEQAARKLAEAKRELRQLSQELEALRARTAVSTELESPASARAAS